MKKLSKILSVLAAVVILLAFTSPTEKMVSKKTHIKFFSHTSVEDIEANNNASVSTIDPSSGVIVFSVPMQSFEFEKALMQKHFNSGNFLDTKSFPKAKLKGKITNLSEVDFTKDGTYDAIVEGEMTLHGETKTIKEKGTIIVTGDKIEISSKIQYCISRL